MQLGVHLRPCKNCPSAWYPHDPESEELEIACANGEIPEKDYLFKCAWRPNKICKGLFDKLQKRKASIKGKRAQPAMHGK